MKKVAMCTPIWKRPIIESLFLYHMRHHIQEALYCGIILEVVVVGSERGRSRAIAEGFSYVDVPNSPLGAKFNAGVLACRDLKPDYWTIAGSDTFFRPTLWEDVASMMEDGDKYMGVRDLFMWKPGDGTAIYWPGYEKKVKPIGPLRFVHSTIMDGVAWRPYAANKERGLDASADTHFPEARMISGKDHLVLSVKTDISLTDIHAFTNTEPVDDSVFYELLAQF